MQVTLSDGLARISKQKDSEISQIIKRFKTNMGLSGFGATVNLNFLIKLPLSTRIIRGSSCKMFVGIDSNFELNSTDPRPTLA